MRFVYPKLWEGCTGAWAPLLGNWGGNFQDHSGHGQTASISHQTPTLLKPILTPTKYGWSANFSSTIKHALYLPITAQPHQTNRMTFTFWFTAYNSTPGYGAILYTRSPGQAAKGLIYTGAFSRQMFFCWRDTISQFNTASGCVPPVGQLCFAVGVVTPTAVNFGLKALGGNWQRHTVTEAQPAEAINGLWYIGVDPFNTARSFDGDLYEIRMYDRVLSDEEINLLSRKPGIAYETARVPKLARKRRCQ